MLVVASSKSFITILDYRLFQEVVTQPLRQLVGSIPSELTFLRLQHLIRRVYLVLQYLFAVSNNQMPTVEAAALYRAIQLIYLHDIGLEYISEWQALLYLIGQSQLSPLVIEEFHAIHGLEGWHALRMVAPRRQ